MLLRLKRRSGMGSLVGGVVLLGISLFVLAGFLGSDAAFGAPATLVALGIGVALPAGAGIALLRARSRGTGAVRARREELRRRTVDAEVLLLAGARGGRLTVVELVQELALSPEDATATLEDLMRRDLADIEITDSGGIVYRFPDVQRLGEKHDARGLLDD
jgi:hypothetical protein